LLSITLCSSASPEKQKVKQFYSVPVAIAKPRHALCNEVESDLAILYRMTSRAFGTAGITPFATTLGDTAQIVKILSDNGTPPSDRQFVIDTTAGASMRTLGHLTKANEAADMLLRQGILKQVHGLDNCESAQAKLHSKARVLGIT